MKKLMFAAAVMAAGAVMAVESQTVGYTTQEITDGQFAMVGVQFEGVASGDGEIALKDFITGDFKGTDWDENDEYFQTATEIQVWDGTTYAYYYYLNEHTIEPGTAWEVKVEKGWCDDWGESAAEVTFIPGQAVWFHNRTGDCTITTPGQVITEDDTEIPCANNTFTMAANFMPVELDLNNEDQVAYDGIVGTDWDENDEYFQTATEIQVWDGTTYAYYYYLNEHTIEPGTAWEVKVEKGWCDDWGEFASDTIAVGRGFWIHARTGDFTVIFKK